MAQKLCNVPGCFTLARADRHFCAGHWMRLPRPIRVRIRDAWSIMRDRDATTAERVAALDVHRVALAAAMAHLTKPDQREQAA